MRKPIHLTFSPPTLEELEKRFPIPKARKKEIQELVDLYKATLVNPEASPAHSIQLEKRRKRASAA